MEGHVVSPYVHIGRKDWGDNKGTLRVTKNKNSLPKRTKGFRL